MRIEVLGSNSDGNAYIISDGVTKIMLECGLNLKTLQKRSGYTLAELQAVLTSHSHGDHSASIAEMHKMGIPVYCTAETSLQYNISGEGVHILSNQGKQSSSFQDTTLCVGTFTIVPFPLIHAHTQTMETCECYGFLIYSAATKQRLLFATDTMYIPQRFENLDYIMLECNYTMDRLFDEVESGVASYIDERRLRTHMSAETAVKFLKAQDLSHVKAIIGLHLSAGKADKDEILKMLRVATGKPCYIAEPGVCVG